MLNLADLQASLASKNIQSILKTVTDLRERIEIVHTQEFGNFLKDIFPILRELIVSRLNVQMCNNDENKCRHAILEVFNRFPCTEVLKPYVVDLLTLSMKVLSEDNEENALTALRIIFELHKSFRPALESHVQSFLDLVQLIFNNIPISAQSVFSEPGPDSVKDPSRPPHSAVKSSSLLPSRGSFKVLTECPLLIMLLFQVYPKFINRNIPNLLPLMMKVLNLRISPEDAEQHKLRFREFLAAQVKILSLITYFMRGFADQMRRHEEKVAENVLKLIRSCPAEAVSTRKELLVDLRHILATDFRKSFTGHMDHFLDETFLMGPGRQAYETLRPLAYSTIADLVHHSRDSLSFAQLSKVVYLFARNINDVQLPAAIQTTSVRILVSIAERFGSSQHDQKANFQSDRKLLSRILRTLIFKFYTMKVQIRAVEESQRRQLSIDTDAGGVFVGNHRNLFEKMKCELLPSSQEETSANLILPGALQDGLIFNILPLNHDSARDMKHLIKSLLVGVKTVLSTIHAIHKVHMSSAQAHPMAVHVLSDDEVDLLKNYVAWVLDCVYAVSKSVSERSYKDVASNKSSSGETTDLQSPESKNMEKNESAASTGAVQSFENDHDVKLLLEPLVHTFLVMSPSSLIRTVLGQNLNYLLALSHKRPVFISLVHYLLMSKSSECSQLTMDTSLSFFVHKLPTLSGSSNSSSSQSKQKSESLFHDNSVDENASYPAALLRMLKVTLGIIGAYPDNEKILRSQLKNIIHLCLRFARESTCSLHYIHVMRTLFRSVSGGKFEQSYREIASILPTLFDGLDYLLSRSNNDSVRCAVLELYLTIPCRLESLLPYFTRLLNIFSRAVRETTSDTLANLSLRTLEFWVENLNPVYLFSVMSSQARLLHSVFSGICMHLKPAPYPYGALAVRVLGKFGGKNRKFLREFFNEGNNTKLINAIFSRDTLNVGDSSGVESLMMELDFHEEPTEMKSDELSVSVSVGLDGCIQGACSILIGLLPSPPGVEAEVLTMAVSYMPTASDPVTPTHTSPPHSLVKDMHSLLPDHFQIDECTPAQYKDPSRSTLALDLNKQFLEETSYLLNDAITSQLTNAFHLLRTVLLEVVPELPSDLCNGRNIIKLQKTAFSSDTDTCGANVSEEKEETLKNLLFSLLCAACYPHLRQEAEDLLIGVCYHFALLNCHQVSNTVSCRRWLDALNGAIILSASSARPDVYGIGIWVLRKWMSALSTVINNVYSNLDDGNSIVLKDSLTPDNSFSNSPDKFMSPVDRLLLSAIELCSFSTSWIDRLAGVRILNELSQLLPRTVVVGFQQDISFALFAVVEYAMPDKYAYVVEEVIPVVQKVFTLCYSDLSTVSKESEMDRNEIKGSDWQLSEADLTILRTLLDALGSTSILVRIAARSSIYTIAKSVRQSVSFLLESVPSQIVSCLSLQAQPEKLGLRSRSLVGFSSRMSFICTHCPERTISDSSISLLKSIFNYCNDSQSNTTSSISRPHELKKDLSASAEILRACEEENLEIVLRHLPEDVPHEIQARLHYVNIIQVFFSQHPNTLMGDNFKDFRNKCVAFLYDSLSLKWTEIIDLAGSVVRLITQAHSVAYPEIDLLNAFGISSKVKALMNMFEQPRLLTVEKLKRLQCFLSLAKNRAFLKIGLRLLEILKWWTDPEKVMQSNAWPGEEVEVAIAIINIFPVFQWESGAHTREPRPDETNHIQDSDVQRFIRKFACDVLVRLQRVSCQYGPCPSGVSRFLTPVATFLSKYPDEWLDFFLDPQYLAKPEVLHLFLDVFAVSHIAQRFKDKLFSRKCYSALARCISAYVRTATTPASRPRRFSEIIQLRNSSELLRPPVPSKLATTDGHAVIDSSQHDVNRGSSSSMNSGLPNSPLLLGSTSALSSIDGTGGNKDLHRAVGDEREKETLRRASANAIRIVHKLCENSSSCLVEEPELLAALCNVLYLVLRNCGFTVKDGCTKRMFPTLTKESDSNTEREVADMIDYKFQEHFEMKIICEAILTYCRRKSSDVFVLFDLVPVLSNSNTLDFTFLTMFFRTELPTLQSVQDKRYIIRVFLSMLDNRTICSALKVVSLQTIIIPILLHLFEESSCNTTEDNVLDSETIDLIMRYAFSSAGGNADRSASSGTGGADDSAPVSSSNTSHLMLEPVKIELLKVATILIEHRSKDLMEHRKDLIKFAWNHLKADDSTTKHWAYANVCKFIAAYETPPKIILQVYVALLRTYQNEHKDLVSVSLDTLVPALPKRLRYEDFVKAMKWTKKVVFEEGHSLPQLIHVWNLIVRHAALFYPFRSHFVPQMVSSISRLGLPPNCPPDHRQVAVGCAEVLIGWEYIRQKKLEQKASSMTSNIADTKLGGNTSLPEPGHTPPAASPHSEKEDEFSLHSSMVQMLANFLVRLGLFVADSREHGLSRLADKCIELYSMLVSIVPMKDIKVNYFERLLSTFLKSYNASSSVSATKNAAPKAAASTTSKPQSGGGKATAGTDEIGGKSRSDSSGKPRAETGGKGRPEAGSKASSISSSSRAVSKGSTSSSNTTGSSGGGESSSSGEISDRILSTFLQFLSASMESRDTDSTLLYYNIGLITGLLPPLFNSDHIMKPSLNKIFRQFMTKIIDCYPPSNPPLSFIQAGFYQQFKHLVDKSLRLEVPDTPVASRSDMKTPGSARDLKSQSGVRGKSESSVIYPNWWILQLLDDICKLQPSWIENHDGAIVLHCKNLLDRHLKQLSKAHAGADKKSCIYATPHAAVAVEALKWSPLQTVLPDSYHSSAGNMTNASTEGPITSLLLCVQLLCNAVHGGYIREYKSFVLSVLHAILQVSDNHILWGQAVKYCCLWVAQKDSPLSLNEQAELFSSISNLDRWGFEINAQCALSRVVALVERVAASSTPDSSVGMQREFGVKSHLSSIALQSYGLMSCNETLRNACSRRIIEESGISSGCLIDRLKVVFASDNHCFENRYWPAVIASLLLPTCSIRTRNRKVVLSKYDVDVKDKSLDEMKFLQVEIDNVHPYRKFIAAMNDNSKAGSTIVKCLGNLPLMNPYIGDSIWKTILRAGWIHATTEQRTSLTAAVSSNIARHDYKTSLTWPEHIFSNFQFPFAENVPHIIVTSLLELEPRAEFLPELLGAAGCAYHFWHAVCDNVCRDATANGLNGHRWDRAVRIIVSCLRDINDSETIIEVCRQFCRHPSTGRVLALQSYGLYPDSQDLLLQTMKNASFPMEGESAASFEHEIWEERWLQSAKNLSQWDVVAEYARSSGLPELGMESCAMLCNWTEVRRLKSSAGISAQFERGNYDLKLLEVMQSVVDQKYQHAEKMWTQSVQMAINKWYCLPRVVGNSNCTLHKDILHFFHRAVESRESIQIMAEIGTSAQKKSLPDLKGNLITWRERLPEMWDGLPWWDGVLQWRTQVFSLIKNMFRNLNDESQLASLHDYPWTVVALARAARKHHLEDVSTKALARLDDGSTVDVSDAYSKFREQILICYTDSTEQLHDGINIINSTNLEYFDAKQKAELFRLKAQFQSKFGLSKDAQQSYSQSVQICPTFAKGWLSWGDFYYHWFRKDSTSELAQSAIVCILKSAENNSENGRVLLARALWLVACADSSELSLAATLRSQSSNMPVWMWIPFLPTLFAGLKRRERNYVVDIICDIAKEHPEAVIHYLPKKTLPVDASDEIKSEEFCRNKIRNTLQVSHGAKLDLSDFFANQVQSVLQPYMFAWRTLSTLDALSRRLLDDYTMRFSEPIPSDVMNIISNCLKRIQNEGSCESTALQSKFVEAFSGISREWTIKEYLDLSVKWVDSLSHATGELFPISSKLPRKMAKQLSPAIVSLRSPRFSTIENNNCLQLYRPLLSVPGQYHESASMFQQPKMDLHVKIVRLLPTFDRVLCHGNVVRYRIRFLGSDGDVHCFDVCLASDDLGQRLDSVTSENMFGQVCGAFDWAFQQSSHTRSRDLSIMHPSSMRFSAELSVTRCYGHTVSLEELLVDESKGSASSLDDVIAYRTDAELYICDNNGCASMDVNGETIDIVTASKRHAFSKALALGSEHKIVSAVMRQAFGRITSCEMFYLVRKALVCQVGVHGIVEYLMNSRAPGPRSFMFSPESGRVESYNVHPAVSVVETANGRQVKLDKVGPLCRLTPFLEELMSSSFLSGIMRTAIGNVLMGCATNNTFLESFWRLYFLEYCIATTHNIGTGDSSRVDGTGVFFEQHVENKIQSLTPAYHTCDTDSNRSCDESIQDLLNNAKSVDCLALCDATWMPWV